MNAEAKFVSSVMDARLKKVKRECESFRKQRDELINDMAEVKRKARAFEEIKANLNHVLDLEKYETLDYKDCKVLREIFKETEDELECEE
ncbi:hypothetical protein P3U69_08630 [Staphylococcus haemolyticus]|uniref:hypothetical protein n=1 Tax=Staphylococcus haemolyticus TaxID=1283 RepID=UPI002B25D6BD|nr:hypothetical protein [Staphylococcus haemolyticus]WQL35185.1 hypothetical protein P3U69_08630 [Staphylococcus haemolyticus]